MLRSRILVRVGRSLDETLSARVYDAIVRLPLKIGAKGDGTQPIRDLDTVRGFLAGTGPIAFFDLPWMPIYLGICFVFHVLLGLTALIGALIMITLTVMTEVQTRRPTRSATQFAAARNTLLEASRRNAEVITAMGMAGRISKRWNELNRNYVAASGRASDVGGGLGAMSKVLRLLLQSAMLAVGAWLVINQQSTAGHHHRRLNPRRARACAGRSRDCQLARLRRRQAKLAAPVAAARPFPAADRPDAPQAAGAFAGGAERSRGAARPTKDRLPGDQLYACRRQSARRDRADGVGKIFAGAHAGRSLDTGPRHGAARRRHTRSMVVGNIGAAHRLCAAGCRIVQWHGGAEYFAFRGTVRCRRHYRRRSCCRRPRPHHQSAGGL